MKKIYSKPEVQLVAFLQEDYLLVGSDNYRSYDFDEFENEDEDLDFNFDGFDDDEQDY